MALVLYDLLIGLCEIEAGPVYSVVGGDLVGCKGA